MKRVEGRRHRVRKRAVMTGSSPMADSLKMVVMEERALKVAERSPRTAAMRR